MKNIALVLAALVGLILMDAREGSAGSKFETVTHVDKNPDGSGRAYGALGASRSSDNAVEFIGCQLIGVGSRLSGGCSATDFTGANLSCFTDDPVVVGAISGMTSEPFVFFTVDAEGRCTQVNIETTSRDSPKVP